MYFCIPQELKVPACVSVRLAQSCLEHSIFNIIAHIFKGSLSIFKCFSSSWQSSIGLFRLSSSSLQEHKRAMNFGSYSQSEK